MHTDTVAIEQRQHLRDTLAEKMAEFERRNGKVQTIPIITRGTAGKYNGRQNRELAIAQQRGAAAMRKRTPEELQAKPRPQRKPRTAPKPQAEQHQLSPLAQEALQRALASSKGTRQARNRAVLREEW